MNAQSLDCSASSSRSAVRPARGPAAHHFELGAAQREGELGDGRPRPGRQVAVGTPRASDVPVEARILGRARGSRRHSLAGTGSRRSSASSRRTSSRPWRVHSSTTASKPRDALVPPVAEQLGVERAHGESAARQARPAVAQPRGRATRRSRRRARAPWPALARGRRRRRRCSTACGGGRCGGGSRGRRRRRDIRRSLHTRSIVARSIGTSTMPASPISGRRCSRCAETEAPGQLDARRVGAGVGEQRLQAPLRGRTRAARSRRASRRRSARGASRCRPGPAGARRRPWRAAAARHGSPRRSTARAARAHRAGRRRVRATPAERVRSRPTSARPRVPAARARRRAGRRHPPRECDAAPRSTKPIEALLHAGRLELVAQHRRERERQRRAARRAARAAAGSCRRSPPTATPRRTATCRSPRRRACACAARSPAHRRPPARQPWTRPDRGHGYTRHTAMKSSAASIRAWPIGRIAKSETEMAGVNQP